MVVPPLPAINNIRDPFSVHKMSVSDFCIDLKPVDSQINMECRERAIPLKKVGLTGLYIVLESVSQGN